MEFEFDKEIDALIRGRGVLVGDSPPKGHLDADEISAFAENALPERTRTLHMAHIADCDRCRRILSNLIALNAEAEPEIASAAVPALAPATTVPVPWYRKLLLFPNLAYVMGGLVLMLGGLIGLSVYQGSLGSEALTSQVTDNESLRGPMAPTEPQFSVTDTANTAANAATAMSNTTATATSNANTAAVMPGTSANSTTAVTNAPTRAEGEVAAAQSAPSTADAVTSSADAPAAKPAQPVAAPPPPMAEAAAPKDVAAKEDDAKARTAQENEKRKADSLSAKKSEEFSVDGLKTQNRARTQAGGVAKATPGPTRDMQQTFPNRADNTYELKSRRVGGKDFQFRDGAWYDTAYRGQGTTNVRRGSGEYRKLDGGVRSIAESLSGVVVVVVSGGKAYRIQ
jgi:hypothetical protein